MLNYRYYIENGIVESVSQYRELPADYVQVYEVLRVIDGVPLFLEDHLERLERSLALAKSGGEVNLNVLDNAIQQLISANEAIIGNIKLILAWDKVQKKQITQLFFVPHNYPSSEDYLQGIATDLLFAERSNPNAKIDHTPVREMANKMIKNQQLFEVLLVDQHGYITEGSRSNCFFIKENTLYTAPVQHILPGVTRKSVFSVCKKLGVPVLEESIHHHQLPEVQALFITGTSPGVLPIRSVGQLSFPPQHPLLTQIRAAYQEKVKVNVLARRS